MASSHEQLDLFAGQGTSEPIAPVDTSPTESPTGYALEDPALDAEWRAMLETRDAPKHLGALTVSAPSNADQIANARKVENENPSHSQILYRG